jgi:hypothetical protein
MIGFIGKIDRNKQEVTAPVSSEGGHFYVIKLLGSCRNLTVG